MNSTQHPDSNNITIHTDTTTTRPRVIPGGTKLMWTGFKVCSKIAKDAKKRHVSSIIHTNMMCVCEQIGAFLFLLFSVIIVASVKKGQQMKNSYFRRMAKLTLTDAICLCSDYVLDDLIRILIGKNCWKSQHYFTLLSLNPHLIIV